MQCFIFEEIFVNSDFNNTVITTEVWQQYLSVKDNTFSLLFTNENL